MTAPLTEKGLSYVDSILGFDHPEIRLLIAEVRAARVALRNLIERVEKNPQLGDGQEYPEMLAARAVLPGMVRVPETGTPKRLKCPTCGVDEVDGIPSMDAVQYDDSRLVGGKLVTKLSPGFYCSNCGEMAVAKKRAARAAVPPEEDR